MGINMGAANYIRKLLIKIKSHIDMNILIVGDCNMPLSIITLNVNGLNAS